MPAHTMRLVFRFNVFGVVGASAVRFVRTHFAAAVAPVRDVA